MNVTLKLTVSAVLRLEFPRIILRLYLIHHDICHSVPTLLLAFLAVAAWIVFEPTFLCGCDYDGSHKPLNLDSCFIFHLGTHHVELCVNDLKFLSADIHKNVLLDMVASHKSLDARSKHRSERLHDVKKVELISRSPPSLLDASSCINANQLQLIVLIAAD